jgi:Flp pilus assembly protein TadG
MNKESGQSTIIAALSLSLVTIGFLAFAIDVGYMFHEKRMAQAAADAAALAAAEEVTYDGSGTIGADAQNAANAAATQNGFNTSAGTNPATVTLTSQGSGNYSNAGSTAAPSTWIQAQVSEPIPTFFLRGLLPGKTTLTVSATAVASGGQSSPTCVCLEGASGQDLNMSNNGKLDAVNCGVTADSSSSNAIGIVGSANVCASSLAAVASSWDNSGNINNGGSIGGNGCTVKVIQGLTSACKPPMPAAPTYNSAQCTNDPLGSYGNGGSSYTVGPGSGNGTTQSGNTICYKALTVGANGDAVTLNSGIYVISGGELHFESGANNKSNLGGNGVMFFLTNGASIVIDNGANVNLVAGGNSQNGGGTATSISSTYNGILVFEDPGNGGADAGDTQAVSVQGGSNTYLNGAIYAPLAALTLGNGSGSNVNSNIVAQSLTMNGGGTLNVTASANLGTANSSVAKLSQ